ncbi:MAG: hypothetical protein IFJ96_04845 [Acidobacteria bacterium]|nr:hypothetical protein [Candidatus Sulfomarinibacter sp. MAG AM2]
MVKRSGILCGGTCTVDRNKRIDHWPREEAVAEILEEIHGLAIILSENPLFHEEQFEISE